MLLIHRLFIKTSLAFLTLGVAAGGWMLLRQAGLALPELRNLYTLHIHLIGVGFFLMMVCGVALWMFPRKSGETREEAARDPLGWTAYLLLTVGLAVRGIGHLVPERLGNPVLIGSVFLQVGGIIAFVTAIWPRIYLPGAKLPVRLADGK